LNVVTVTLRPGAKLPPGTNITITGLPTDVDFSQPCPTYNHSVVSEPCIAANGMCKWMPVFGPGKDIFTTSPGLANVPAAQAQADELFLTVEKDTS